MGVTTWKLLAILGTLSLISGLAVVGVDAAYGWLGKTPGTIAMLGVAMMSAPWLALAAHLKHQLQVQRARDAHLLSQPEVVRQLSRTDVHRTLTAIAEEHGAEAIRMVLGEDDA